MEAADANLKALDYILHPRPHDSKSWEILRLRYSASPGRNIVDIGLQLSGYTNTSSFKDSLYKILLRGLMEPYENIHLSWVRLIQLCKGTDFGDKEILAKKLVAGELLSRRPVSSEASNGRR